MKEKTKTIYYCDHCNRKYFYKKIMAFHEQYCGQNPANKHICLKDCENLKITNFVSYDSPDYVERKEFYCKHFERQMYSYKGEMKLARQDESYNKLHLEKLFDTVENETRMPLECKFFDRGDIEEKTEVINRFEEWRESEINEMEMNSGALKHSDL